MLYATNDVVTALAHDGEPQANHQNEGCVVVINFTIYLFTFIIIVGVFTIFFLFSLVTPVVSVIYVLFYMF